MKYHKQNRRQEVEYNCSLFLLVKNEHVCFSYGFVVFSPAELGAPLPFVQMNWLFPP